MRVSGLSTVMRSLERALVILRADRSETVGGVFDARIETHVDGTIPIAATTIELLHLTYSRGWRTYHCGRRACTTLLAVSTESIPLRPLAICPKSRMRWSVLGRV